GGVERLGPELAEQRMLCQTVCADIVKHSEPALVVEADAGPVVEREDHMVMGLSRGLVLGIHDRQSAWHAQMPEQRAAVLEIDQNVLCAAPYRRDAAALSFALEPLRDRPPQVGSIEVEPGDAPPGHASAEASHDGLDFGKLGHLRLLGGGSVALCGT